MVQSLKSSWTSFCEMRPITTKLLVLSCHVESVVLLNNKNSKKKDYVEIGVDAEDYYKIKANK